MHKTECDSFSPCNIYVVYLLLPCECDDYLFKGNDIILVNCTHVTICLNFYKNKHLPFPSSSSANTLVHTDVCIIIFYMLHFAVCLCGATKHWTSGHIYLDSSYSLCWCCMTTWLPFPDWRGNLVTMWSPQLASFATRWDCLVQDKSYRGTKPNFRGRKNTALSLISCLKKDEFTEILTSKVLLHLFWWVTCKVLLHSCCWV